MTPEIIASIIVAFILGALAMLYFVKKEPGISTTALEAAATKFMALAAAHEASTKLAAQTAADESVKRAAVMKAAMDKVSAALAPPAV